MNTITEQTATAPTGKVAKPVTLEKARELLRQAVDAQGEDFVYNPSGADQCAYRPLTPERDHVKPDDPRAKTGCVVGEALVLAGETRHLDSVSNPMGLHSQYPDMLTWDAAYYFWEAQRVQDRGGSWGAAFEVAERSAGWSNAAS
ncbi:hypothetical protein AB0I95_15100 [Micromonospora sp. NPDC049751]|uniref:hypothetical protein n=1 Tax=Micromonospora sp. NPDC049751 TaxID=3154837 RepID=UPI0033D8EE6E